MSATDLGKSTLARIMAAAREALEKDEVREDLTLFDNGGDSLAQIRFMAALAQFVDAEILLSLDSDLRLNELAALFQGPVAEVTSIASTEPVSTQGASVCLANRFSYFAKRARNFFDWTTVTPFFQTSLPVSREQVTKWIARLVGVHEGLRLTIGIQGGRPIEFPSNAQPSSFLRWVEVDELNGSGSLEASAVDAVEKALANFGERSELFSVVWTRGSSGRSVVALAFHHLLVDGISKGLLARDLVALMRNPTTALETPLPYAASFGTFCEDYHQHFSRYSDYYLAHWEEQPWELAKTFGTDWHASDNREEWSIQTTATLKLGAVYSGLSRQVQAELILTSIGLALREWKDARCLHLAYVAHGRSVPGSTIDYLETIGWLSEPADLLLDLTGTASDLLAQARNILRYRTDHGRALPFLRYLEPRLEIRDRACAFPTAEMSFNFEAQGPAGLTLPPEVTRLTEPRVKPEPLPDTQRPFLMSGGAWRRGDNLTIGWDFSSRLFRHGDVALFTDSCVAYLEELLGLLMTENAKALNRNDKKQAV